MDFSFLGLLSCTGNQLFEAVDPAKAATWEDFEWYLNKNAAAAGGPVCAARGGAAGQKTQLSGPSCRRGWC